ncbi:uncharacterized protein G2W53_007487 [Senna tora]|uniref:Uncharacterized protein n=1 Tax=Senna tora TaxID=362788 RepID=A0A834X6S2_9FABA|nr:uncharacterized protein G2W53_007487 [Senna tora]
MRVNENGPQFAIGDGKLDPLASQGHVAAYVPNSPSATWNLYCLTRRLTERGRAWGSCEILHLQFALNNGELDLRCMTPCITPTKPLRNPMENLKKPYPIRRWQRRIGSNADGASDIKTKPYQQVSHLIYRMPYVSDGVRFFPCELMDDGGVNQMFVCHATCLPYLPMSIIEICVEITGVQQDSASGDYIPEAPLQTVMSQEFLGSQLAADEDKYGGAITEVERLLSIPTAAPNDDIRDEEYEDQLMVNDIEDRDYEEENPNDYE